jgi:hypothetical protein
MQQRMPWLATVTVRYALWGVGLGIAFSFGATWLTSRLGPASGELSTAQGTQLFHYLSST